MSEPQRKSAIVTGGGSGVGRATVLALAAGGTRVWAVGRDAERLERVQRAAAGPGEVTTRAFDAANATAMDRLIDEAEPDLIVHAAGARARLALAHEQSWESFSEPWNVDVKIAFQIGQTAIRRPLRPGSLVVFVSSGAALGGSPLSGGYAGAKRMQMFLAGYFQRSVETTGRGIKFAAVVPKQLIAGTELAETVADAYAALGGISRDKYMERFGAPLTADGVAQAIVGLASGGLERAGSVVGVTGSGMEPL